MYKKCYAKKIRSSQNQFQIDLWTDSGHERLEWTNYAYKECHEADATHIGLNGHPLIKTSKYKQRVVRDKKKYTRKKLINFTDY